MIMLGKKRKITRLAISLMPLLVAAFVSLPSAIAFVTSGPQGTMPNARRTRPFLSNFVVKNSDTEITSSRPGSVFDPLNLSQKDSSGFMIVKQQQYPEDLQPDPPGDDGELSIWAARAILLLVAIIWATNFASVKYLENLCFHPPCHHPPSEPAFARFSVAALVSLPFLFRQRWDVIKAGLECGTWISLGYITQALALSSISAGKCAFICSLTVVFVPLGSAFLYGKPVKPMNVLAAIVALSGVGVLEGLIDFNDLLGIKPALADTGAIVAAVASSSIESASAAAAGPLASLANMLGVAKGDIIALGQPIGFGYSFLRIEHYQEQFKDVPNRVLTIAAAQCVAVGIVAFFWLMHDFNWTLPDFSYMLEPHRLVAIGWTGIVTTVVAIFLEGIALQKASATDAAITFATEPVWASLFGFLLLGEKLGTSAYIGGAIILTACLVGAISDLNTGEEKQGANLEDYRP